MTNAKQLLRHAAIGFVMGLVVVSGLALVTWQSRAPTSVSR